MINGFCTGTLIKSLAEKIKCRTKAFKLSMKPRVKFEKIRKFKLLPLSFLMAF